MGQRHFKVPQSKGRERCYCGVWWPCEDAISRPYFATSPAQAPATPAPSKEAEKCEHCGGVDAGKYWWEEAKATRDLLMKAEDDLAAALQARDADVYESGPYQAAAAENERLESEAQALRDRCEALKKALRKIDATFGNAAYYGKHHLLCNWNSLSDPTQTYCNCGLNDIKHLLRKRD